MIKYLGSKRTLIHHILDLANKIENLQTVLDAFSGTSRVGYAFKNNGQIVTANDHTTYAYKIAQCYIEADKNKIEVPVTKLINELNKLKGKPGYFTETFCVKSRFFQPKNGERIDAIREEIKRLSLEPVLEAVLLVSLMEASDKVDSTCGVQMAYLKKWAQRSNNDLVMKLPDILPGLGYATQMDAKEVVKNKKFDLVYMDPPYNQHKYLSNYHIWETLVKWDKPEAYGVAMKRTDVKTFKSDYNSKSSIKDAFKDLINNTNSRYLLVSFNNEGYMNKEEITTILETYGETSCLEIPYKRYIGSQIGIYNPSGEKVGKVKHKDNKEYLFLVGDKSNKIMVDYNKSL